MQGHAVIWLCKDQGYRCNKQSSPNRIGSPRKGKRKQERTSPTNARHCLDGYLVQASYREGEQPKSTEAFGEIYIHADEVAQRIVPNL